jgi:hypothetical protein
LTIVGVMRDRCRGCVEASVRMCVDCGGKRAKFFIQLIFEFLHGLDKVFLGEEWVDVGGVAHSFSLQ